MPHFSPADLLRQKSIVPASYEHTQNQAAATWTTRLVGKEQIRAAENDETAAEAAYQTAMQTFAAIRQQVGM